MGSTRENILKELASRLPQVMHETKEQRLVTGQELIDMGMVPSNGVPYIPTEKYLQELPVQIAANHYRRMKRAYNSNGQEGVQKYIDEINALSEAHKVVQRTTAKFELLHGIHIPFTKKDTAWLHSKEFTLDGLKTFLAKPTKVPVDKMNDNFIAAFIHTEEKGCTIMNFKIWPFNRFRIIKVA